MAINKCKKCGCEDNALTTPAPCPTPTGCPTPNPCGEVFDAQCVVYTGETLSCDDNVIVAANNTVAEAFNNIIDYFCESIPTQTCPPQVSIVRNSNGTLTATASEGSGSFNFEWEFSSAVNGISNMFGTPATQGNTPTTSTFAFSRTVSPGTGPAATANSYDMYIGLAKVIATDTSTGCVAKDTYLVIDLLANG